MKWEYKIHDEKKRDILSDTNLTVEEQINELGTEGWELVSVIPIIGGYSDGREGYVDTRYMKFIFKRAIIS
ncbi:DUF4177 domain-containing protein [Ureibacillus composti]